MRTLTRPGEPLAGESTDEISAYCQDLFAPLARSDQRRWGEVYLRGLLHASGRRTPSNISEQVLGRRTAQPIQQFVNHSTWESGWIRRQLAEAYTAAAAPRAWAFDEVAFPKNGTRSVGVARQFASTARRTINCQLALATSLVHPQSCLPVNWHLMLPRHWDDDEDLRDRAHVPHHERHRPRWHYLLDSVDELLQDWDLPQAPVLADWTMESQVEPLLLGLEDRGLGYLLEVGAASHIPVGRHPVRVGVHHRAPHTRTVAEVAHALLDRAHREVIAWRDAPAANVRRSQFLAVRLPGGPAAPGDRRAAGGRVRHLIAEWPFGRPKPRTYWLTNLPAEQLAETVALAELRHHSARGCERLHREYGLGDFEGRSFRGWHHHVTLVSAARGFHTLQELGEQAEAC
ncbi:IS701 family transposase [Kitasatospora terrestris]|uniref:IS701 family transposase n=1 Tax=Kitasatospora terrestris TaxID=258051 RepID=A0ABP9DQ04_9ACTN